MSQRLCHVLFSGLGGHAQVVFSLVEGSGGDDVSHSLFFCGNEPLLPCYRQYCNEHELPHDYSPKVKKFDLNLGRSLMRSLQKWEPDVLFIHSAHVLPFCAAFRLWRPGLKLVYVEHQSNLLKSRLQWLMSSLALLLCSRVVFLTELSRDQVLSRVPKFLSRREKTVVVGNGVDTTKFKPKNRRREPTKVFGMLSRMTAVKDHETLLRAAARLLEGGSDFRLILAGEGETRPGLEVLAGELGLLGVVGFPGLIDPEDVPGFLNNLDVYVHASHGETMSTSILQAQACGLPIVASDVLGVNNLLSAGTHAFLVPPQDSERLKEAMLALMESDSVCKQMGEENRRSVSASYSQEAVWERYRILLDSLLGDG